MIKQRTIRLLAAMLAVLMFSGCGGETAVTEPDTRPATEIAPETEPTFAQPQISDGIRYPVEWAKDAVIYEVNVRQYTEEGTFNAFSEHLQTLKDMGITTLWFMPIHPISETRRSGVLGSYYSITDYRAVNPEFGTAEDFKALVDKAHDMGFTVMMDWVANHTGWDCEWIESHPEWYTKDDSGNITDPIGMGWPDVADLNYGKKALWREMIDCMAYWVEEYDVDGFRCDYANGVSLEFWEAARAELTQIKPLLMLAEDNSMKSLLNYAFDLNYNWNLYDALLNVSLHDGSAYAVRQAFPYGYPDGTYRLNFLNNHDKNSWEHSISQAFDKDTLPAMWALLYTLPGTPMVYSGDEIGLAQNIAFMEKDPIRWDSTDTDYRPLLKELADIRRENPALHAGNYGGEIQYTEINRKSVIAFTREVEGNTVKCLFNLSGEAITVDASQVFDGGETVLLHGQGAALLDMEDQPLSYTGLAGWITLQPWEFWITNQ